MKSLSLGALEEAKRIAQEVMSGQTQSYVQAAIDLADFVLGLVPGTNVIEIADESGEDPPYEPFEASPSTIPREPETEDDVT